MFCKKNSMKAAPATSNVLHSRQPLVELTQVLLEFCFDFRAAADSTGAAICRYGSPFSDAANNTTA